MTVVDGAIDHGATSQTGVAVCVGADAQSVRFRRSLRRLGLDVFDAEQLGDLTSEFAEPPAVVLFDDLSHGWLGAVARLVERWPTTRTLLVADLQSTDDFLSALAAGVAGFCPLDASDDAIDRTLRSMFESGVAIPRAFVAPLVETVRHGRGRCVRTVDGPIELTDREWEVLQMLVQRRTTREMADTLYVAVGTVRSHVSAVLKKLGALDREEVIALMSNGAS